MMSNSRIPSPARSLGVVSSPRRYRQRRSRSVCSPGRLETSVRLTAIISDSFVVSPLPKRRSVLNDDTEIIDMPKRKCWWRKLDENSRDVIELLEHKEVPEGNNIDENFDVEILSQEKKNYTLDLPESSDGESISSIVIPQRRLFTQKENHPPKKFPRIFNNRDELVKLQKSHVDHDKEIDVRPKNLFNQAKKAKSKPIFPSALLNISTNKSMADKTKENPSVEPKAQVRNLFGNRPGTKRKNMFADFLVSESEDEVPEIQAKVFGFQKKSEQRCRVSDAKGLENSLTTSILDVDFDDFKQLPSSTMMENQIEDLIATPSKRTRLSRLPEIKDTTINKSLNKSKRNESLRSNKSKLLSSSHDILENIETNTSKIQKPNQSKTSSQTQVNAQSSKLSKTFDVVTDEPEEVQNKTLTQSNKDVNSEKVDEQTKPIENKNTIDCQELQEQIPEGSDGENNFTLEYENDEDNLEHTEKEPSGSKNDNKGSSKEILEKEQDKNSTHNQISQTKIIDTNRSHSMNVNQNLKNSSRCEDNNIGLLNNEMNNTKGSTIQNQSIKAISNKLIVEDTTNNKDAGNKSKRSNSLHSQIEENNYDDIVKNNAEINRSTDNLNKSPHNLERSEIHNDNEECEESIRDDVESEVSNKEDSSDESIQLDESKTHNESQESQNTDGGENNDSCSEINETEKDASKNASSLHENELEQEQDCDNNSENNNNNEMSENINKSKHNKTKILDNDNNVNNKDENIDKSKHNETKVDPPEAILFHQSKNFIDSFTVKDGGSSPRKTKSMFKNNLRPSLAPVRESTGFSDNTANSSDANSGWDSHRTTRKTLRKTFGKDFTPRKSLRTLVMEKSAKQRQTFNPDLHDISKHPRANSTELPDQGINEPQEQLDNEIIENHQMEIEEDNVIVTETPDGTENHTEDDQNMETEEIDNANNTREQSEVVENQTQSEESDNAVAENTDDESDDNLELEESGPENDATDNQQTEEENDQSHNMSKQTENESDHDVNVNNDTENQEDENDAEALEHSDNDVEDSRQYEESGYYDSVEVGNNTQENHDTEMEQPNEESNHDFSRRMKQRTLEIYLEKINKQELERRTILRENLMDSLKTTKDTHYFKVPSIPMRKKVKSVQKKVKTAPVKTLEVDDLPAEIIKDLKYKPPRRYQPKNASWATARLYKYLETKLEPKYDYMARVRAEKLVSTLHEFTKHIKRHDIAPTHLVTALKQEMARLKIVDTHYEFYNFFHEFMPREIRVKVNPDIVNRIQLPKDVFSNIIR